MDWFKKQKMAHWLIGLLVLINILTLTLLWTSRQYAGRPPFEAGRQEAERGRMVTDFLQQELQLSQQQVDRLRTMRERDFENFNNSGREVMALRRQMIDALFQEPVDSLRLNVIADEIGRHHARRALDNLKHFQNLRQICTPEQREKFLSLIDEIMPDGPPPGGPGPEAGRPGMWPGDPEKGRPGEGMRPRPPRMRPGMEKDRSAPRPGDERKN